MKNFVQHGKTIVVTAGADIASGDLVTVGATVGVAAGSALNTEEVVLNLDGVYTLPKASATVIAQGAKVYVASGLITTTVGSNVFVGYAHAAAGDGAVVVDVLLAR